MRRGLTRGGKAAWDEACGPGTPGASWRCRRIDGSGDISITLASTLDVAPETDVSNANAFAILEMLGLQSESLGMISLAELRHSTSFSKRQA